ncbi:MAG: hypothetical protein K2X66_13950 [Cyanobacteria bacterium]|nr:hypothetical protein [Cyanobacteriota bacterium]
MQNRFHTQKLCIGMLCFFTLCNTTLQLPQAIAAPLKAASSTSQNQSFLIIPGKSVGPITANTSREQLNQLFGSANVSDESLDGPEGDKYPATLIFKNDPARKLIVTWKDEKTKLHPQMIQIQTTNYEVISSSRWSLPNGIKIGTSLKELQTLNQKPFTLSGFEWDYGGRILSWEKGTLQALSNQKVFLQLINTHSKKLTAHENEAVSGDQTIFSTVPAMQKLNPQVAEIDISF